MPLTSTILLKNLPLGSVSSSMVGFTGRTAADKYMLMWTENKHSVSSCYSNNPQVRYSIGTSLYTSSKTPETFCFEKQLMSDVQLIVPRESLVWLRSKPRVQGSMFIWELLCWLHHMLKGWFLVILFVAIRLVPRAPPCLDVITEALLFNQAGYWVNTARLEHAWPSDLYFVVSMPRSRQ